MKRCPFAAPKTRGAHELCIIIPSEHGEQVVLAICPRCGESARYPMELPLPMDDLPADAIARMAQRRA